MLPEQITTLATMQVRARQLHHEGKRIGLVPTMGFLHPGHLSLMHELRKHCDSLWVSIFVNPTQFAPGEDLDRYPRNMEGDLALCAEAGVDGIFAPQPEDVYPPGFDTWVEPGDVANHFCGASRPGHFRGVLTIVHRLFMLTRCDVSIFGQKDAQQLFLIQKMVRDLHLPLEVFAGPLIRDLDGLAMSSRNKFLSGDERKAAGVLNRTLHSMQSMFTAGDSLATILQAGIDQVTAESLVDLEYLHIVDRDRFHSLAGWSKSMDPQLTDSQSTSAQPTEEDLILLIAARVGQTRLIDTIHIQKEAT
jgi:pantoate--beta-alanine ligase